mgnify:CR=1 FL=1
MIRNIAWFAIRVLGIFLIMFTVYSIAGPEKASAVHRPCNGWYGRNCWFGYFSNGYVTTGENVIDNGIPGIPDRDKQAFINRIGSYLNSGDAQQTTAAQFIILSMSGYNGGVGKSVSGAQWNDWVNRVNNPAIDMRVQYAFFDCDISNSYYQTAFNDVAAGYSTGPECGRNDLMIDFYSSGTLVYRIRVACANPLGNLPGLPPAIPPTTVSCGSAILSPPNPTAQLPMTVTVSATYSGGPPTPTGSVSINVQPTPGGVGLSSLSIGGGAVAAGSNQFTVSNGGTHTVYWSVRVNETTANCSGTFYAYPPTIVSCGSMVVNPPNPEVAQPMSVRVRPSFTGGPPSPSITGGYIRVTGPGFSSTWPVSPTPPVPSGPGGGTITFNSPSFNPPQAGTYTVTWDLRVNTVAPTSSPCGGNVPVDTFEVMNYPFMSVQGGDIAAGSSFVTTPGGSCGGPNTNAGVVGWNRRDAPTYRGSGNQYGISARSFIQDFVTNKGSGRPAESLSFAGVDAGGFDSVNPAMGRYGGFFGKSPCAKYWSDKPTVNRQVTTPSISGLNGVYMHTGPLTINPSNINPGTRLTIYVDGDVSIRGPLGIRYSGGADPTWANPSQIPVFRLIVRGTIHIDPSVDRLDGTYVAVPEDSAYPTRVNGYSAALLKRGTISTCSNGFTVLNPLAMPAPMIDACNNNPLTVNGSFVANHIFFLRTSGTMSLGPPAEVFNFSPETWLAPANDGSIDPSYQSVVGLPPVL